MQTLQCRRSGFDPWVRERSPNKGKTMKKHTSDSQKKDEGVAWA